MEFEKYTKAWPYVKLIAALAIIIALIAGCGRQEPATNDLTHNIDEIANEAGEERNISEPANGSDPVVATVNGININASTVYNELPWSIELLTWTYFNQFPDDDEIDLDRIFKDDLTFGQAVRREAARFAALGTLLEDYAARNNVHFVPDGVNHPAFFIIQAIIDDPSLFAEFEQYMENDDALERAEALLQRARDGEDFDYLIQTYGEDPGMIGSPEGYTFVSGVMVPEFEAATMELGIGEISGLVRSNFGFHIIMRVEPNPETVMRPHGQSAPEDGEEELLGAKHILIMSGDMEEEMFSAIIYGFEAKLSNAELIYLPALDDLVVNP